MRKIDYGEEDYLALVRKYNTEANYNRNLKLQNLPPTARIKKKYGSWGAARKEAETVESGTSTFLYLVHFWDEDFYKVGLTKVGVKKRFRGYPSYSLIDKILMGWEEGLRAEAFILSNIKERYKPISTKFKGGHTECYKSDEVFTLNYLLKGSGMAWTKEEEKELIKLHSMGISTKLIAEELGRAQGTIANKCTRLGLSQVNRWTKEDEDELTKLSNEGHSNERIALRLNRTVSAIKQKITRMLKG